MSSLFDFDLIPPVEPPPTIPPVHPIPSIDRIGYYGHLFQWIGFGIFAFSTLAIALHSKRYSRNNRAFHILTAFATAIAALSYYAAATGTGYAFVYQGRKIIQGKEVAVIRQIYWARYIDWALSTPLIILNLGLLSGLPWLDIVLAVAFDEALFVNSLFGALRGTTRTQWGWYAFAWVFLGATLYTLVYTGRQAARLQHERVTGIYFGLTLITASALVGYQVVFVLANIFNLFNADVEIIVYTALDVASKVAFAVWLLLSFSDKESDQHAGVLPDSWVEPRSHTRGIRLPGGD